MNIKIDPKKLKQLRNEEIDNLESLDKMLNMPFLKGIFDNIGNDLGEPDLATGIQNVNKQAIKDIKK